MIREGVLELSSQIVYHLGKDPHFEKVVSVSPFMVLKKIDNTFNELEKASFRVAGNDN